MTLSPLTPAQSALYMWQQRTPDSPAYQCAYTFELQGPLDRERFAAAFAALAREDDRMATVFVPVRGGVRQGTIPADQRPGLDVLTGSVVDSEDWVSQRSARLIPLDRCCYDAALLCLAPDNHLFYLNQHQLIADPWGVAAQYRRLASLYAARAGAGGTPPKPGFGAPAPRPSSESEGEQPDYPASPSGNEPPLESGRQNPAGHTAVASRSLHLGADRVQGLRSLGDRMDVTLSALLSAYVHRLRGEENITIGTPTGHWPTTLPNRLGQIPPFNALVRATDTFLDLLARHGEAFAAFHPSALSSPGIQVVLKYCDAAFDDLAPDVTCRTTWHSTGHADPDHHFTLRAYHPAGTQDLRLDFILNRVVFTPAEIERIPDQFLALVDACLADPARPVASVNGRNDDELRAIAGHSVGPTYPVPTPDVLQLFEAAAARYADDPALSYPGGSTTYRELNERADRLAQRLHDDLEGGKRIICLSLPRSPGLLVAILGCWKAGYTYVPLPTDTPDGRLEHILRETDAALVITDPDRLDRFRDRGVATMLIDENQAPPLRHASPAPARRRTDAPAYVMYTSGSTGQPKGVVIGHTALVNYIDHALRHYVTGPKPVFPLFTTIGFDLTVTSLFTPLACGGRLEIYSEPPPGIPDLAVVQVMHDDRCDVVKLTPSHLALLRGMDLRAHRLRTLIVGGEQLTTPLAREIREHLPPTAAIINEYGPTEATVGCIIKTYTGPEEGEGPAVPIGRPIANTEAWVLDAQGNLAARGTTGELFLGGICLAEGYLQREELTAERFATQRAGGGARLYRTGDRARWNGAGDLEFLGRADRQAKWRGHRIELDEIENLVAGHPNVTAVAVVLDDEQLVAYYTSPADLPAQQLRAHLQHHLPDYSIPQRFIALREMPLTPAGKVNRRALAEMEVALPTERPADFAAPEGEIEELLAGIWCEVLAREEIGRHDKFLDLGGHSLTAIRLAARISDTFALEVPLPRIFELPTIALQASYLEETMLRFLAESETTPPDESVNTTP
ncbi:non-ribosomal peptide synthetase [Neolewinella litorea]|uniref:Non-ribosomal peptide synthetase n=1 Tax=Neolewinella litorea TaxID=2562452 RepID=A0A4S4N988_9BACT|nr:amino acid adenylation domain-containing protein [Neolewinella litorea]THH34927.1 non-ribosomal peptide synthetase [Neolewinella litorea]